MLGRYIVTYILYVKLEEVSFALKYNILKLELNIYRYRLFIIYIYIYIYIYN